MMGVHALVDKNGVMQQQESSLTVSSTRSPALDIPAASTKSPNVTQKRRRYAMCRKWDEARTMKKSAGIRQKRRNDDLVQLMCMVEDLEEVDIVEPSYSPFTALFMEHEKMKVWNDFLNRPEEMQQEILQHGLSDDDEGDLDDSFEKDFEKINEEEGAESVDGRQDHPAFSADECFSRIDSRLRMFLNKSHVPLGTLEHLEKDLLVFFNDYPTSVLITKLGSSFERLLLHALCQYLDLSSRSFDDVDSGGRRTEVENKQQQFTPPDMTLTQYLEQSL